MTRPLELTVYERVSNGPFTYIRDDAGAHHSNSELDARAAAKRFTDAELAAEYHRAVAHFKHMQWTEEMLIQQGEPEWTDEKWEALAAPMNTLHRFATHPHHTEQDH